MASRTITPGGPTGTEVDLPAARRRRRLTSPDEMNVRYFLLKPGSTLDDPELGEEIGNIKQALVRSFKSNQPFLTVTAWNAVEDIGDPGGDSPVIVKQAVARP